jgi:hypothetical protein
LVQYRDEDTRGGLAVSVDEQSDRCSVTIAPIGSGRQEVGTAVDRRLRHRRAVAGDNEKQGVKSSHVTGARGVLSWSIQFHGSTVWDDRNSST